MKNLLLIFTLLFSTVFFPSPSYAEWTKVGENINATFYVDFERSRKHSGFVYYWKLIDVFKPNSSGDLSIKAYDQVDCKMFRYKYLSGMTFSKPMGAENAIRVDNRPGKDWRYPPPNSANEALLKSVCSR